MTDWGDRRYRQNQVLTIVYVIFFSGVHTVKVVLEYKKSWWFARFRKLKVYMSEKVFLTEIKQGERKEVEIPDAPFEYNPDTPWLYIRWKPKPKIYYYMDLKLQ